jgi:hypothetical protein
MAHNGAGNEHCGVNVTPPIRSLEPTRLSRALSRIASRLLRFGSCWASLHQSFWRLSYSPSAGVCQFARFV